MKPENEENCSYNFENPKERNETTEQIEHDEPKESDPHACKVTNGRKKVDNFALTILVFFTLLQFFQIPKCEAKPFKEVKCNKKDIQYKNKASGLITGCRPCPECPPGQHYSIPCGSIIDIDSDRFGRCVDCPEGQFSDKFSLKQCRNCVKVCTNREYIENCTKEHDAKCGGCLKGYKEDPHSFSCNKVEPSKPTTSTSSPTTATTAPKPSQSSFASLPSTSMSSTVTDYLTSTTDASTTSHESTTFVQTTKGAYSSNKPMNLGKRKAKSNDKDGKTTLHIIVGVLSAAFFISVIAIFSITCKRLCFAKSRSFDNSSGANFELLNRTSEYKLDDRVQEAVTAGDDVVIIDETESVPIADTATANQVQQDERLSGEQQEMRDKSFKVSTWLDQSSTYQGTAYETILHKVNALVPDSFKSLVRILGIPELIVYQFYPNNGTGNFNLALKYLTSCNSDVRMEDLAHALEKKGYHDIANLAREEDRRLQTQ